MENASGFCILAGIFCLQITQRWAMKNATPAGRNVPPFSETANALWLRKVGRQEGSISRPPSSLLERHEGGMALCLNGQFRRQQALYLVLCDMGAINDIGHEFRSERQGEVIAIEIAGALIIH
jgi:hypothetical protein